MMNSFFMAIWLTDYLDISVPRSSWSLTLYSEEYSWWPKCGGISNPQFAGWGSELAKKRHIVVQTQKCWQQIWFLSGRCECWSLSHRRGSSTQHFSAIWIIFRDILWGESIRYSSPNDRDHFYEDIHSGMGFCQTCSLMWCAATGF